MNVYKALTQITGERQPVYLGEIVSINSSFSEVRVIVQLLPSTAQIEVLATGKTVEVGQRFTIQAGVLLDEAPMTSVVDIEV